MQPPPSFTLLISCTCIYTIASLILLGAATGNPIPPPDFANCQSSIGAPDGSTINCCPPTSPNIVDFRPSPPRATLRVRRAAHLLNDDYIQKYANATALMKSLPPNHPWNFIQQANLHCAYCDFAFNQTGSADPFQVHSSWLFYPYHRAYLYFYERILGRLISDDEFALPFWAWDVPDGMSIPLAYIKNSSLYDGFRDVDSQPPNIMSFSFGDGRVRRGVQIHRNLVAIHRIMVREGKTAELFLGGPVRAGNDSLRGTGSLEGSAHATVHVWTGADMADFVTAGRDPVFYAHHANVDRMWEVWRGLPGGKRVDFNDSDWLDSSFLFWDENLQLVRIRVRDVVSTETLGYVYQDIPIPWLNTRPKSATTARPAMLMDIVDYPIAVDAPVSLEIMRPDVEGEGEEVLVVEMNARVKCRLDVYINAAADDPSVTSESSQFVGSFTQLAGGGGGLTLKKRVRFGLTDLLEDIGASGDKGVVVTLVPRTMNSEITVESVWIEFSY